MKKKLRKKLLFKCKINLFSSKKNGVLKVKWSIPMLKQQKFKKNTAPFFLFYLNFTKYTFYLQYDLAGMKTHLFYGFI